VPHFQTATRRTITCTDVCCTTATSGKHGSRARATCPLPASDAQASRAPRDAAFATLLGVRLPGVLHRAVRVCAPLRGLGGSRAGSGAGFVLAALGQPRPARRDP